MAASGQHQSGNDDLDERTRRDSHLALGCGFAFALTVVGVLIVYILATA